MDEAITITESDSVNIVKTSKAQKVVKEALDALGLEELVVEELAVGPFRADFALPGLKLLIEINGPYHFYYKSSEPTSRTVYKQRTLEANGFRILNIDYLEMKEETNRVALMDSRLRSALGISTGKSKLRSELIKLLANS
jgi:very-short-patch-repair endonuclease